MNKPLYTAGQAFGSVGAVKVPGGVLMIRIVYSLTAARPLGVHQTSSERFRELGKGFRSGV